MNLRGNGLRWLVCALRHGLGLVALALPMRGGEMAAAQWDQLLSDSRWFELRDAVPREGGPVVFEVAVAIAFNDLERARTLVQTMPDAGGEPAVTAHTLLAAGCYRAGRYREALGQAEIVLRLQPDKRDIQQLREWLIALARHPDLAVAERRLTTWHYTKHPELSNWFTEVLIDGKPANYMIDTGAECGLISTSEATRLGLTIEPLEAETSNAAGTAVKTGLAVADRLRIGDCELRHVVFRVLPDDLAPFSLLAPGERGVIGLPVFLALRTVRWEANGAMTLAFPSRSRERGKENLCFESSMPVTRGEFRGRPVVFELDTGGGSAFLSPRFAAEFGEELGPDTRKQPMTLGGVGGARTFEALVVPELSLRVGGLDVVLRETRVLLDAPDKNARRFHGLLGLPVLDQARRVSLDFEAMTLTLE